MATPTVTTSAVPYCTPTFLLNYINWRIVADALRDGDGPQPTRTTILDATSDVGAMLVQLCLAASGELESACIARELYTTTDLAALTGATQAHLRQIVAGLIVMRLFSRGMPIAGRMEDIPAVKVAMDALTLIGEGKRIFGLVDQASAGAGSTPITQADVQASGMQYTVTEAYRFFGQRGQRGGLRGGCN